MGEKTVEDMIRDFVENGLNLSYFKFISDHDKENFFNMYIDLFESLVKEKDDYYFKFTEEKDLNIYLNGEEVFLYIIDDYETLKCTLGTGYYDKENESQILILTVLFLTVKELKAMIDLFTGEIFENMQKRSKENKMTKLSTSFIGKANNISSRLEGIMDNIDKVRAKVTIKEIK